MTRQTLLFLFLLISSFGYSQTELHLKTGAKYQPGNFYFQYEIPTRDWREMYDFSPVFQAEIGLRHYFPRSKWFIEENMMYRHARFGNRMTLRNEENTITGYAKISYLLDYAGLKVGTGFRLPFRENHHAVTVSIGLQGHVKVDSRLIVDHDELDPALFHLDDMFKNSIYYGIYLQPTYEFSLSQRRSNPWRFLIYLETDLLIQNEAENNPIFLWGGGLGVSYRLGSKF